MTESVDATRSRQRSVLMLPSFRGNPYQTLLKNELEALGWNVILGNSRSRLALLDAWLRNGKPGILHLHWTHGFVVRRSHWHTRVLATAFSAQVRVLRALGVQIVWTVHNIFSHDQRHLDIQETVHRSLAAQANAVTVHCEAARSLVMKQYRLAKAPHAPINIVPHGSYWNYYANDTTARDARNRLGIPSDAFVFLFLGHVKEYKGVVELIDAFHGLNHPGARLVIAGSASPATTALLNADAEGDERIVLRLARVEDADIQVYMNAADFVVLPFRDILTSGSAWLAMSFGKAVIVPGSGCLAETLDHKGAIFLGETWDVAELRDALERALDADSAGMGMHNETLARNQRWSDSAIQLDAVYRGASHKG